MIEVYRVHISDLHSRLSTDAKSIPAVVASTDSLAERNHVHRHWDVTALSGTLRNENIETYALIFAAS